MTGPGGSYASYLLRLWRDLGGERPVCRASLECAQSGKRAGFADMEELCSFLSTVAEAVLAGDVQTTATTGSHHSEPAFMPGSEHGQTAPGPDRRLGPELAENGSAGEQAR
jgi:hypothetical protein